MTDNNCLIFGGGGFIGSHICDRLIEKGYKVTIFDKLYFNKANIEHLKNKVKIIEGDFTNEVELKDALKNINIVFHLVSSTLPASSNQNPIYDVESNLVSTLRLLDESLKNKIKRIIFISSGGTVYGIPGKIPISENHPRKPICSYGITKKTIEDYFYMYYKLYGLDYTVFRLSNPYGERQNPFVAQGVIPVFLKKIIKKEQIEIWGDGSVKRDYIYIKDSVKLIVDSLEVNSETKIFNLAYGKGYTINEILEVIGKITKLNFKVKYSKGRAIDVPVNVLDNSLAKKTFNWKPEVSLEEGIQLTYEYLKKLLIK